MLLGLLADIHESADLLRLALARFRSAGVDQVVVLGDVVENGRQLDETCRLLAEAKAVGVWGNHDFGLRAELAAGSQAKDLVAKYGRAALDFLISLKPRLEIASCLFTHVEPWLDPEKFDDLWYFDGFPDTPEKRCRIFSATSHRICFAGHFHRWLLATPENLSDWQGGTALSLAGKQRFFVVCNALCDGHAALWDTNRELLSPLLFG